jgi:N-acetylglutamate synthase-like GNAT family acetyltransferase
MNIREATSDDNQKLQELQAKCPQGKTLIVSIVNTPDFFARCKAYELYKVYVAHEGNRIIGSHACAMRNAMLNGKLNKIGYSFQTFISPDHRKKGLAKKLLQYMEDHLIQNGAALVYGLIMEGNLPSMKLVESLGFKLHRTLVMPGLAIYKEMEVAHKGAIRPMASEELVSASDLLNDTWQGYDFYEPTSAEALIRFVNRTPAYSLNHLLVLEDQGEILACLGFWDWGQIMKITMKARSLKMQMMGSLIDIARNFRPLPRIPRPGDTLKQWCLTPMGFKDPKYLAVLLRYLNNLALQRGIEQIFCICKRDHALLSSTKGFIHVDTAMHLYVKTFQQNVISGDKPVFIDGIDL